MPSTCSQTLKGFTHSQIVVFAAIEILSGPVLISRTGDEGCSLCFVKASNIRLLDTTKGVVSLRQQGGGHGSRNPRRSV